MSVYPETLKYLFCTCYYWLIGYNVICYYGIIGNHLGMDSNTWADNADLDQVVSNSLIMMCIASHSAICVWLCPAVHTYIVYLWGNIADPDQTAL